MAKSKPATCPPILHSFTYSPLLFLHVACSLPPTLALAGSTECATIVPVCGWRKINETQRAHGYDRAAPGDRLSRLRVRASAVDAATHCRADPLDPGPHPFDHRAHSAWQFLFISAASDSTGHSRHLLAHSEPHLRVWQHR